MSGGNGGMIGDSGLRGISPRQHHDPDWPIGQRVVTYSARVQRNPKLDGDGAYRIDDPALEHGDDLGWHLWEREGNARDCSAWFGGPAPSVVVGAGGTASAVLPLRARDQPDDRFVQRGQDVPAWASRLPKNWTGLASTGTEEHSQTTTWHPDFLGLVAPNKDGDPDLGTRVFDLDASNAVDPNRWGRLQDLMAVVELPEDVCGVPASRGLALQLGPGGRIEDGIGYAAMVDYDHNDVAIGSHKGGGPLTSGGSLCQHKLSEDVDGKAVRPLHFHPDQTLWVNERGDAPLRFDREFWRRVDEQEFPHWRRCYVRLNKEAGHSLCGGAYPTLWEIQVSDVFYYPEDDRFPPPPLEDPDGGGGGGGGGGQPLPPTPTNPAGSGVLFPVPGDEVIPVPGVDIRRDFDRVNGAGGKRRYPTASQCLAVPGVQFKAVATNAGEVDVAASPDLSEYARWLYDRAPTVAVFSGLAQGSGSWGGFEYSRRGDPSLPSTAAGGGIVVHSPEVSLPEILADEVASGTPCANVILPEGVACLDFASPSVESVAHSGVRMRHASSGLREVLVGSDGSESSSVYRTVTSSGHELGGDLLMAGGTTRFVDDAAPAYGVDLRYTQDGTFHFDQFGAVSPTYDFEGDVIADTLESVGDCYVGGKLTVVGLIDPTGLVLDPQSSDPMSGTNVGLYAGDTAGAEEPLWRQSDGSIHDLLMGGASGILARGYREGFGYTRTGANEVTVEPGAARGQDNDQDIRISTRTAITTTDAATTTTDGYHEGGAVDILALSDLTSSAITGSLSVGLSLTTTGSILPHLPQRSVTGTITSSGTAVTGTGTRFLHELAVGDVIGTTSRGYAAVASIESDTALTLVTAFPSGNETGNTLIAYDGVSIGIDTEVGTIRSITIAGTTISVSGMVGPTAGDVFLGVMTNNRWYSVWVCSDGTNESAFVSAARSAPIGLAAGWDARRVGFMRRSSSDWVEATGFALAGGSTLYVHEEGASSARVLSVGSQTTFTDVATDDASPPESLGHVWNVALNSHGFTGAGSVEMRRKGVTSSTGGIWFLTFANNDQRPMHVPVIGHQPIQYKMSNAPTSSGGLFIDFVSAQIPCPGGAA